MIFSCKNCDGNMVYSPEKRGMICPYCESLDSHQKKESDGAEIVCPSCGGELKLERFDSTTRCPYCDTYIILDRKVKGEYVPDFMIPFQIGKETCKHSLREKFKKHTFAPVDFLAEARLNGMLGMYVPYWFYDYKTQEHFRGEGTKVRSWVSGNTRYTETSYFNVVRDMNIEFEKVPADASWKMPDDVMDLMCPYDYGQLERFKPEYLSGFYAEYYNMPAEEIESRAKSRVEKSVKEVVRSTYQGYHRMQTMERDSRIVGRRTRYGLLPVWKYDYAYKGKAYPFYINGQNGKIVGSVPVSIMKAFVYTMTLWFLLLVIFMSCAGLLVLLASFVA